MDNLCLNRYHWSGRFVNNTIAQSLLCIGKNIFNIFNALATVMLLLGVYVCANRGRLLPFRKEIFLFLLFIFWMLNPTFSTVALWAVGSCHYIWPAMWLVWFLIPYIRKYYEIDWIICNKVFSFGMFLFGILAGNGNENTSCWILIVLFLFMWKYCKEQQKQTWMYTGLFGMVIGYLVLLFAPGNMERAKVMYKGHIFSFAQLELNVESFLFVVLWQFVLWYFCFRFFIYLKENKLMNIVKKEILLVKICFVLSFFMSFCMLFSPAFYYRSGFPGFIQLMIASGILFRFRLEQNIYFWNKIRENFYIFVMISSFFIVSYFSFFYLYEFFTYNCYVRNKIKLACSLSNVEKQIVEIKPFKTWNRIGNIFCGYHKLKNCLKENENNWENVTFARYYGIGGIRVEKSKE